VQPGELTYGASLELASKVMGCSVRTLQRYHRHPIAQQVKFVKKRLCRGAMDVNYWVASKFRSWKQAEKHFNGILRSQRKEGKAFADFMLSYAKNSKTDPIEARYTLPIYRKYLEAYGRYLEAVNYKPARMVLRHPLLSKFKLIPITIKTLSHRRTQGYWTTTVTEAREILFIENLTNIYAAKHLKVATHRRFYGKVLDALKSGKNPRLKKGPTVPHCHSLELTKEVAIAAEAGCIE
ncbi:hypothetical protein, partial [Thermosynechococcus sp.]|uniref:hypothetical protein n=1 Tax=Thermosynechococcus sp. TaxID=2814275 RepID=UPI00391DC336